jgi:hypothetical protein
MLAWSTIDTVRAACADFPAVAHHYYSAVEKAFLGVSVAKGM